MPQQQQQQQDPHYVIYTIRFRHNDKQYIGMTKNMKQRWRGHRCKPSADMKKDLDAVNLPFDECFYWEHLQAVDTYKEAVQAEAVQLRWATEQGIKLYNRLPAAPGYSKKFVPMMMQRKKKGMPRVEQGFT